MSSDSGSPEQSMPFDLNIYHEAQEIARMYTEGQVSKGNMEARLMQLGATYPKLSGYILAFYQAALDERKEKGV